MKINTMDLIKHIDMASMDGLVKNVVFGKNLSFAVTDETGAIISICQKGMEVGAAENSEIGISDIKSLIRAVRYAKKYIFGNSRELEMNVVDNGQVVQMVFEKDEHEFRFLVSDPKTIATTVENADDLMRKVSVGIAATITLTPLAIGECLRAIKTMSPAKCVFTVNSGEVMLLVEHEYGHSIETTLGYVTGTGNFKVSVEPAFLAKVLSVLPKKKETNMSLRDGMPLMFDVAGYTLLLAPKQ